MTKYKTENRLALAGIERHDRASVATTEEWIARAQALTAFAMERLPPELPPITTFISSIENGGVRKARLDD